MPPRRGREPDIPFLPPFPPPIGVVSPLDTLELPRADFDRHAPGRPTVIVRANGTILLPRGVRNALLLDPGERVSVGFEQGVLTVRPVETWLPAEPQSAATRVVSPLDREIDRFLRRRRRRAPG